MKKIFFLDIDGTLTDATRGLSTITDKTRYAINKLCEKHYVFISSGRCKTLLPDDFLSFKNIGYITTNGAYGEFNGKVLFRKTINPEIIAKLKAYCLDNQMAYILERQDIIYYGGDLDLYKRFTNAWSMKANDDRPDEGDNDGYYLTMIVAPNEEMAAQFEKDLKDYVDIRRHYSFTSYDVGEYGISKGYGVERILEILDIPKEETYAFGDEMNDYEMIKAVGHGIAMANANDNIKQIATEVCGDVIEDGFYYYLINNKLIEPME